MNELIDIMFGVDGRMPRRGFWILFAIVIVTSLLYSLVVYLITGVAVGAFGSEDPAGDFNLTIPLLPFGTPSGLEDFILRSGSQLTFVLSVPMWFFQFAVLLSAAIRRLHDRNREWRIALLYVVVPFAYDMIWKSLPRSIANSTVTAISCGLPALLMYLWVVVDMGFLRGTAGANRFGPDPFTTDETEPADTGVTSSS